jgi:transketolase N-terminal domain/subunit
MRLTEEEKSRLTQIAARIRADIVEMTCNVGSGHPGRFLYHL